MLCGKEKAMRRKKTKKSRCFLGNFMFVVLTCILKAASVPLSGSRGSYPRHHQKEKEILCVHSILKPERETRKIIVHIRDKKMRWRTEFLTLWKDSHSRWGASRWSSFSTNSKDSRSLTTSFWGGELSLKHMVETRSTKKLLHICRKRACFSMTSLGND